MVKWAAGVTRDLVDVGDMSAVGHAELQEGVRNLTCRKIGKQVVRHIMVQVVSVDVDSELPESIPYRCLPPEAVKRLNGG